MTRSTRAVALIYHDRIVARLDRKALLITHICSLLRRFHLLFFLRLIPKLRSMMVRAPLELLEPRRAEIIAFSFGRNFGRFHGSPARSAWGASSVYLMNTNMQSRAAKMVSISYSLTIRKGEGKKPVGTARTGTIFRELASSPEHPPGSG